MKHDDRQLSSHSNPGFRQAYFLPQCQPPCLQCAFRLCRAQQDGGSRNQVSPRELATEPADPADPGENARLMDCWGQSEIGANIAGSLKARRIADGAVKGQGGDWTDARDGHEV